VNCHLLLGFQMQYNNSDLLSPETQQQFLQIPCVVWLWKTQVVILIILFIFALVHSGLASLRGEGEKLVGERAYRVLYAVLSLPLAVSAVVCNSAISIRFQGALLWLCSNPSDLSVSSCDVMTFICGISPTCDQPHMLLIFGVGVI
jgi:hypothetical protein